MRLLHLCGRPPQRQHFLAGTGRSPSQPGRSKAAAAANGATSCSSTPTEASPSTSLRDTPQRGLRTGGSSSSCPLLTATSGLSVLMDRRGGAWDHPCGTGTTGHPTAAESSLPLSTDSRSCERTDRTDVPSPSGVAESSRIKTRDGRLMGPTSRSTATRSLRTGIESSSSGSPIKTPALSATPLRLSHSTRHGRPTAPNSLT